MNNHKSKEKKQWDVVLPDASFVLQQWLVRDGSAVQPGDKVATAVKKSAATSSETTPVVKHKRPTKRKRVVPKEVQNNKGATDTSKPAAAAKSISAHLPPTPSVITITAPAGGVLRISRPSLADSSLKIGTVEPCQHPAIMGGLCAVCGASIGPPPTQAQSTTSATLLQPSFNNNNQETMSQVTVSGGVTMTISETEAKMMSQQTSTRLLGETKLSLVLDLDHTLVHATADARARTHYTARRDVRTLLLPIQMMDESTQQQIVHWMQHYVKLRPHVDEFLIQALQKYEISVYTAGTRVYAEHVCMLLSRNMVGATLDEDELQQLRHDVMRGEYQVANKQANVERATKKQTKETDTSSNKESKHMEKGDNTESPATNGTVNETIIDDPPKKKSVSFGEPPKETKTDEMTPERLEELKKELQEAEKLEQQALDVRQQVFGSRIVSRTDVGDLGRDVKSLERIFPGGGSMTLIVDDREDVWANAQDNSKTKGEPPDNLLLIRPYHYKPFLGFADVNNAAGEDISGESTTTEDEDDCALLWTLDILKRMHARFYTAIQETGNRGITVPPLIREMRQEVLEGCTLVFSGLIPLHQQNRTSQFPRPAVVRFGEGLGATVKDNVDTTITHMVAARDGTDKIHKARRVPGCYVVKASWLMECVWTMTRRDVTPHLLGKPPTKTKSSLKVAAAIESSSSDDDDDDEDLAAMLEADMMD